GQVGGLSTSAVHNIVAAGLRAGATADELEPLRSRLSVRGPATGRGRDDGGPQGGQALVEGQFAEARGALEDAVGHYRRAGASVDSLYPYERGTAHVGAARCLIALGCADDAKAEVVEAEQLLGGWEGWRVEELEAVRR